MGKSLQVKPKPKVGQIWQVVSDKQRKHKWKIISIVDGRSCSINNLSSGLTHDNYPLTSFQTLDFWVPVSEPLTFEPGDLVEYAPPVGSTYHGAGRTARVLAEPYKNKTHGEDLWYLEVAWDDMRGAPGGALAEHFLLKSKAMREVITEVKEAPSDSKEVIEI